MNLFIILKSIDENVLEFFKNFDCLITIEKLDVNPHSHIILSYSRQIDSFRKLFLSKFPNFKGNRQFQITEVKDFDKSFIYILKECNVFYNSILSNEKLEEFLRKTKEITENQKKSKKIKTTWSDTIFESYEKLMLNPDTPEWPIDQSQIREHIINYLCGRHYRGNHTELHMKSLYWRILSHYYPEIYRVDMRKKLFSCL